MTVLEPQIHAAQQVTETLIAVPNEPFCAWAHDFEGDKLDQALNQADISGDARAIAHGMSDLYPAGLSDEKAINNFLKGLEANDGKSRPMYTVRDLINAVAVRSIATFQVRPGQTLEEVAQTVKGPALFYRMGDALTEDIKIEAVQLNTSIENVSILLTGSALRQKRVTPGTYLTASMVINMK